MWKILWKFFSCFFLLIMILASLIIASLNASDIIFNYYFGVGKISLSLLLIYTLSIGIVMGSLFILYLCVKINRKKEEMNSELTTENSIENLPNT